MPSNGHKTIFDNYILTALIKRLVIEGWLVLTVQTFTGCLQLATSFLGSSLMFLFNALKYIHKLMTN